MTLFAFNEVKAGFIQDLSTKYIWDRKIVNLHCTNAYTRLSPQRKSEIKSVKKWLKDNKIDFTFYLRREGKVNRGYERLLVNIPDEESAILFRLFADNITIENLELFWYHKRT